MKLDCALPREKKELTVKKKSFLSPTLSFHIDRLKKKKDEITYKRPTENTSFHVTRHMQNKRIDQPYLHRGNCTLI